MRIIAVYCILLLLVGCEPLVTNKTNADKNASAASQAENVNVVEKAAQDERAGQALVADKNSQVITYQEIEVDTHARTHIIPLQWGPEYSFSNHY